MEGSDILVDLPERRGHFLLESGYHTNRWLTLDALFLDPAQIAPSVDRLGEQLAGYTLDAVCGPLLGGAFLAQAMATKLGLRFLFTEPESALPRTQDAPLFSAEYRLPKALTRRAAGLSIAVVDDVISAGSSVRASIATLSKAGASVTVVAALATLGNEGRNYLLEIGIPLECLHQRSFDIWAPSQCPMCAVGTPLEVPELGDREQ